MDLSPLIDCVLQLLVFFMLSSTFASPKVELALPRASSAEGMTRTDSLILTVAADGSLFVGTERVPAGALEARLTTALAERPEKRLTFRGHGEIPYQRFVEVLATARRAGATHVDLAHASPASTGSEKTEEAP